MRVPKISGLVLPLLAAGVIFAPSASAAAGNWDDFTYITFSAPVEIPGHALPAGRYLFEVADTWNLDLIQIYNSDGKLVATLPTLPMYQYEPPRHSVIQFEERPGDTPEALAAWFPRGQRWGHRFLYSHQPRTKSAPALSTRP